MSQLWKFFYNKEWAVFVAVVTAVVAQLPALGDIVTGEVSKAGDHFSWAGLLVVVAGVVIRFNVWARETVDQVKATHAPLILPPSMGAAPGETGHP